MAGCEETGMWLQFHNQVRHETWIFIALAATKKKEIPTRQKNESKSDFAPRIKMCK